MSIGVDKALERVSAGTELSGDEMRDVIRSVMEGDASPDVVADLLTALHTRGETTAEIAGAAQAMRDLVVELPHAPAGAIDTAGTGGDDSGTFNISTLAAIVAAGAGAIVAKHGNRAATSQCGSAEVLESLGVRIDIPPLRAAQAVHEVGIGFLYARACHPAMAAVAPIRAALAIPTIFNRLGPLTNPMFVTRQLVGVGRANMIEGALQALAILGSDRVWVVHSEDGLDEISTAAPTRVATLENRATREFVIDPSEFVAPARIEDLKGGDAQRNAEIARSVLAGKPGPHRDVVLLNAAAALCVASDDDDISAGVQRAANSIDSGAAAETLERWVSFTGSAAQESR
ncbi:MAG: anthranilate phosphoribosyltransferase [Acidimicrobiia bacterium]